MVEAENNPFAVLGLDANATLDSIKSAYRRLAMRWHPDRNPDPSAAAHFQMVQAAYELLSAQFQNTPPNKKRNIHQALHLTLLEAYFGTAKEITVQRRVACDKCAGSGKSATERHAFCKNCLGSGRILKEGKLAICQDCDGKGLIASSACPECLGSGKVEKDVVLIVNVPCGVLTGDELRLTGQGESAESESELSGDLYLNVVVESDEFLSLENRDLHCAVPLSLFDFMLGAKLKLPFLDGVLNVDIPPMTKELKIEKRGFPAGKKAENQERGALFLHFSIVFPQSLDEKTAKSLKRIAKTLAPPSEIAKWLEDFTQHFKNPR